MTIVPRTVVLTRTGRLKKTVVTTPANVHHRNGYCRIGQWSKVFCSCGWKDELEGTYTEMMAAFAAHKA